MLMLVFLHLYEQDHNSFESTNTEAGVSRLWPASSQEYPALMWTLLWAASSGFTLAQGKFVGLQPLQSTLGALGWGVNQILKPTWPALMGPWKVPEN